MVGARTVPVELAGAVIGEERKMVPFPKLLRLEIVPLP
jgi:hypothetical protein